VLNAYFGAVDLVLQPTIGPWQGARQQLGGQVGIENCWIDGKVVFDSGEIEPPGALVFPISIITG
jgi:hypothetical protein